MGKDSEATNREKGIVLLKVFGVLLFTGLMLAFAPIDVIHAIAMVITAGALMGVAAGLIMYSV